MEISLINLEEEYLSPKIDGLYMDDIDILKKKISLLSKEDKAILLLYVEFGSLRKTAKILKCSHSKIGTELKRIKKLIIEK